MPEYYYPLIAAILLLEVVIGSSQLVIPCGQCRLVYDI